MPNRTAVLSSDQADPALLNTVFFVQQVCLALVVQVAALALFGSLLPSLTRNFPLGLTDMSAPLAFAALFSAISFFLSEPGRSRRKYQYSRLCAILTALIAAALFLAPVLHNSFGWDAFLNASRAAASHSSTPLRPATAFILMTVVMILVRASGTLVSHVADFFLTCLSALVLILVSEYLFGALHILSPSVTGLTSLPILICIVLLTAVAVLRRAECGIFSLFLGRGISGRIARTLAPFLLVIPFIREAGREKLIDAHVLPVPYTTAILASTAVVVSFALLVFLARRIDEMERAIHDLALRDELTGLYNLRGFRLLASQSLRLAQRGQLPFSVLFIDLDDLKQINDRLGHKAGSAFLAETAELLSSIFRETDVTGRIGGDEFAVAGQFSHSDIATIAERLGEAAALRNSHVGHRFPLSFSTGYVTCEKDSRESLTELVSRADKAMYEEKRRKKRPPTSQDS